MLSLTEIFFFLLLCRKVHQQYLKFDTGTNLHQPTMETGEQDVKQLISDI